MEEKTERLLYSVEEAIVLIGLGKTKVYQLISSGELEAVKCGRRTLVTAQAVQKWISQLPKF